MIRPGGDSDSSDQEEKPLGIRFNEELVLGYSYVSGLIAWHMELVEVLEEFEMKEAEYHLLRSK